MRKASKAILASLVTLVLFSFPVFSQEKVTSFETYTKWRAAIAKRNNGLVPDHYSLAAVTRRTGATSARIDFTVVGELTDFVLEIQPLKIQETSDGQHNRENAGELSKIRQRIPSASVAPNHVSQTVASILVNSSADAVEVKWRAGGGKDIDYTIILPLQDTPFASVTGTVASISEAKASNVRRVSFEGNSQIQTGRCYAITDYNDRCGYFGACCIGSSSTVDHIYCRVSCTRCPNPRGCTNPN